MRLQQKIVPHAHIAQQAPRGRGQRFPDADRIIRLGLRIEPVDEHRPHRRRKHQRRRGTDGTCADNRDAATHDALARVWRDAGLAHLGIGDAQRAVFFAPESPIVHNTLGTIFQALGRRTLARSEYQRALQLDSTAVYALNNLCYGWVLEGQATKAIAACEQALRIDPAFSSARNNLGLAHAVAGDSAAASAAFALSGDRASERYNTGIVRLADRDFNGAIAAFESAHAVRPALMAAASRAQQARAAQTGIEDQ